jgi:hypothetical protein
MKTAYLSSAYLAPVEYYTKLLAYDKIFIEQHDHYMKQTYRNRCTITGPDGTGSLYPHRKARYTEMPNERYPDFRPRQLETPALERY